MSIAVRLGSAARSSSAAFVPSAYRASTAIRFVPTGNQLTWPVQRRIGIHVTTRTTHNNPLNSRDSAPTH
ncbi:hypothetical protein [Streptomyces enissocaesilis]|uniref:Secreted protein n=1 Tax=Streptomyces enissocaesilis TaxID=332589 RepID=A0ABN3WNS4_9ACTN